MAPAMPRKTCKKKTSMGRPVARLMISTLNLRVSWKPVNPQECEWRILNLQITKTILQEKETNHCNITSFVHKFIPMPQAMKIPAAKAAADKEWEKLEKILRRGT